MKTALLVDDEERMLNLLELFLLPQGYRCLKAKGGMEAMELLKKERVHFVLLDVMMPEMDGWEACQKIRQISDIPIIMLTARRDKTDIVKGLDFGADEYITKPFDESELIARIRAILRRTGGNEPALQTIRSGPFELDLLSYTLRYAGSQIRLTMKEFQIIKPLISRPSRVYSREELLHLAWDHAADTDIRTVDSHVRNLRDKLKRNGFPIEQFLKTVWGIGYKWH